MPVLRVFVQEFGAVVCCMRPRALIVVLLLMNYMGLADKHDDKLDVVELFAGTAVARTHAGCQHACRSQNSASN